jgi:hypothetical protein
MVKLRYWNAEHCGLYRFVSAEDEARLMACECIHILIERDSFHGSMLREKSHCVHGSHLGRKIAQPQNHDFSAKLQNFITPTKRSN